MDFEEKFKKQKALDNFAYDISSARLKTALFRYTTHALINLSGFYPLITADSAMILRLCQYIINFN